MARVRDLQINTDDVRTNNKVIDDTINELLDNFLSAGYQSGGALTDNLDGTIDIAAGEGYLRSSNSDTAPLQYFTWDETTGITLTDDASTYVYIDYNAGSPIVNTTTTGSTIRDNENDVFELYEIVRDGTTLHVTQHTQYANNVTRRTQQRFYDEAPVKRTSGLIIGETGTRNVTVSQGKIWTKLYPTPIAAIDTSGSDTFDRYYRDGASGYTKQAAETQWDNLNYDDGTGTLNALGVSKWANQFFYMEADGELVSMYGRSEFNAEAGAETESRPADAPTRLGDHAVYIGRVTFQQNAATGTFQTAFADTTGLAVVSRHDELANLSFDASGHGTGQTGFQRGTTNDTTAPTVNDDNTSGYRPGDFWVDTSTDYAYECLDASTGAAIWKQLELSTGGMWQRTGTTISLANAGDNIEFDATGGIEFSGSATNIVEFSIDGTLGDDSDTVVSTEKAVKTYVDNHLVNGVWTRTGTDVTLTNAGDILDLTNATDSYIENISTVDTAASAVSDVVSFNHKLSTGVGETNIGAAYTLKAPNSAGTLKEVLRVEGFMQTPDDGDERGTVTFAPISEGETISPFIKMISEEDEDRVEFPKKIKTNTIAAITGDLSLSGGITKISATSAGISINAEATVADAPAYMFNFNGRIGASSNGFGYGFKNRARNASSILKDIGIIDNVYTDVTNGSEDTKFDFKVLAAGSEVTAVTMDGTSLKYPSHPTFTADAELVDKKYVDDHTLNGIWTRTGTDVALTNAGDTVQFDGTGGIQFGGAGQNIVEFSIDGTLVGDSDTALPTEKAVKTYVDNHSGTALPRGYISGITVGQDAGDTKHDIEFGVGEARDVANNLNMALSSALTKQIDATWAEGNDQGGFATGTVAASTWYHLFIISKPSASGEQAEKTDAGYDTSVTATNLLANAAVIAAGYTKYRWVGAVSTDGSADIIDFFIIDNGFQRQFVWKDLVNDAAPSGTGPGTGSVTLRVPPGKDFEARINVSVAAGGAADVLVYLRNPAQTDLTPDNTTPIMSALGRNGEGNNISVFDITTNTSQTINYRTNTGGGDTWDFYVSTSIWYANTNV